MLFSIYYTIVHSPDDGGYYGEIFDEVGTLETTEVAATYLGAKHWVAAWAKQEGKKFSALHEMLIPSWVEGKKQDRNKTTTD